MRWTITRMCTGSMRRSNESGALANRGHNPDAQCPPLSVRAFGADENVDGSRAGVDRGGQFFDRWHLRAVAGRTAPSAAEPVPMSTGVVPIVEPRHSAGYRQV